MNRKRILATVLFLLAAMLPVAAQEYSDKRLQRAADATGIKFSPDTILPARTYTMGARDGRALTLRTDVQGRIEHIGIPLFKDLVRLLQPSPVYDFIEYALLNKAYAIDDNQFYLDKVVFRKGGWHTLLSTSDISEYECQIENRQDKLYIVTWSKDGTDAAVMGIPIDYELLNNDTRRNMERGFVNALRREGQPTASRGSKQVSEDDLSIYGTEGLFAIPGQSYIIDLLNQNVYYRLTTIYETEDTIISGERVTMKIESVMPQLVRSEEFPAETFANLVISDDAALPDPVISLDFHLSDYHRESVRLPLSQLKAFCQQQGCSLFFASSGPQGSEIHGVMFASNLPRGYNHLFSLRMSKEQLTADAPEIKADVYLYIPPIDKSKLFGTAPTKKSGVKFNLP